MTFPRDVPGVGAGAPLSGMSHPTATHLRSRAHHLRSLADQLESTPALRLEHAAMLLRIDDTSIEEIAFLSGFNAHPGFSRAFKRQYGVTPAQYRRHVEEEDRNKQ